MRNPFRFSKKKELTSKPQIIRTPNVRVLGYNLELNTDRPKRVLLSYLSQPVADELNGGTSVRFSNDGLATSWPKVLNRLGYIVDIINWDDTDFVFLNEYDLVISHGGINYNQLAKQFTPKIPYIYFSTGSYWKFHNKEEKKRFAEFTKRHGAILPNDRFISHSEEAANKRANAIICLGNQATADTYGDYDHVYHLPTGSYTTFGHQKSIKEIEAGRYNILFLAGAGNIHKGLDLVLDAISEIPKAHLYIYTFLDDAFVKFYKKQLSSKQVTVCTFEAFPNEKFLELTRNCNIVIMPSCSEGSPGSIIEGMIQGLIPIVSREAHIDVEPFGTILKDNSVETIVNTIRLHLNEKAELLKEKSRLASQTAIEKHSKDNYERTLFGIMKAIERNIW